MSVLRLFCCVFWICAGQRRVPRTRVQSTDTASGKRRLPPLQCSYRGGRWMEGVGGWWRQSVGRGPTASPRPRTSEGLGRRRGGRAQNNGGVMTVHTKLIMSVSPRNKGEGHVQPQQGPKLIPQTQSRRRSSSSMAARHTFPQHLQPRPSSFTRRRTKKSQRAQRPLPNRVRQCL